MHMSADSSCRSWWRCILGQVQGWGDHDYNCGYDDDDDDVDDAYHDDDDDDDDDDVYDDDDDDYLDYLDAEQGLRKTA